jgi:thiopeptide-type bacteriocin biosynthesis protein
MSRPQWLGFRVAAADIPQDLLRAWIASLACRIGSRRWFYLWHAEGGLHLRIRIRVRHPDDDLQIAALLEHCAGELGLASPIHSERYVRTVHGFGETLESLLAELLHVRTSKLALQLIGSLRPCSDSRLWVVAACSVWTLVLRGIPGSDRTEYLQRALSFTRRVGRIDVAMDALGDHDPRVRAVTASAGKVGRFLENNRWARQSSRLLARLWRRGGLGRFVAVHGIHMFCNELGLSIQREYVLLRVLAELHPNRMVGPVGQRGSA